MSFSKVAHRNIRKNELCSYLSFALIFEIIISYFILFFSQIGHGSCTNRRKEANATSGKGGRTKAFLIREETIFLVNAV